MSDGPLARSATIGSRIMPGASLAHDTARCGLISMTIAKRRELAADFSCHDRVEHFRRRQLGENLPGLDLHAKCLDTILLTLQRFAGLERKRFLMKWASDLWFVIG